MPTCWHETHDSGHLTYCALWAGQAASRETPIISKGSYGMWDFSFTICVLARS
jgi:hypothetical protein